MGRLIGIGLLLFIWGGFAIRSYHPSDLHGDYSSVLRLVNLLIDFALVYPPAFIVMAFLGKMPDNLKFEYVVFPWALFLTLVVAFITFSHE